MLPAIVVYGFSIPLIGVPSQVSAVRGASPERAGTASGVANSSNQLGAALGVATVASVSALAGVAAGFALTAAFTAAVFLLVLIAAPSSRHPDGPSPHRRPLSRVTRCFSSRSMASSGSADRAALATSVAPSMDAMTSIASSHAWSRSHPKRR